MSKFEPDPLGEDKCTVLPGLIHKHPDRILVEMNFNCPKVCEYCTRKRKGINKNDFKLTMDGWLKIEGYIKKNSKIREIMFSGGDPLITQDLLVKILERLKDNQRIKIIRIHTRIPITAPKMVSKELLDYFTKETKKRVIYLSIHCDHKDELTLEARQCIEKLRLSGVILYSQTVFLKNINDSVKALKGLFEALLELGVRPYYLYQCDKIEGWQKFTIPLDKEKRLMKELNSQISGLACPILVIDSVKGKKRVGYGF